MKERPVTHVATDTETDYLLQACGPALSWRGKGTARLGPAGAGTRHQGLLEERSWGEWRPLDPKRLPRVAGGDGASCGSTKAQALGSRKPRVTRSLRWGVNQDSGEFGLERPVRGRGATPAPARWLPDGLAVGCTLATRLGERWQSATRAGYFTGHGAWGGCPLCRGWLRTSSPMGCLLLVTTP